METPPKFVWNRGGGGSVSGQKTCNVLNPGKRTKDDGLIGSLIVLSIRTKINELGWPWTADTHSCRKDAYYGFHQKNFNEDRPILSATKCRLSVAIRREQVLRYTVKRKHMRWWQAITQLQLTFVVEFPNDSSIPDCEANTCSSELYVSPHLSLCVLFITIMTGLHCTSTSRYPKYGRPYTYVRQSNQHLIGD